MAKMSKKYKIAELVIEMEPDYPLLLNRAKKYEYDGDEEPVCAIRITEETYHQLEEKYPEAGRALIEYMITGNRFYMMLTQMQGLLLHSSAVAVDGKAYLFSAPSGTGKSTHTQLWLRTFGNRATLLNDDKPAIRVFDEGVFAYGTPWSGKHDYSFNEKVPLQGIAFLSRGSENKIVLAPKALAIRHFLEQTVRPKERDASSKMLDVMSSVIDRVPIYLLSCNMEPEAVQTAYNAMVKGEVK